MRTYHAQKCSLCGKSVSQGTVVCKKCANSSFVHLENQLVDSAGSVVGDADVSADTMFAQPAEIVPLS